ncbi:LOW QUALITY PROTEIN: SLAIN motif-containing protein-like [Sebastes umbrosus]|uniref:LOW QUALITY PROTEIN: SLAIN motif-containing protein-like n=1 Tax=Sebastes umbrosus TaxID=72105 RepID=UPI00189F434A|nr:LOW QUALITY PROTEIN: SLAIN motif-containing protein-like [Sebastes umbrosus]
MVFDTSWITLGPEMEAAMPITDKQARSKIKRPISTEVLQFSIMWAPLWTKTSVSTTHNISDSSDNYELGIFHDSMTTSYRLQDTTDVHFMARVQEASLRQDYVPMPARRRPESPPSLSSLSASPRQSPTPVAKRGCPNWPDFHQQVTQFKLLKLAQNQATSPGRTRSPLRTSLRSLQAVRNSRSLDTDNCPSADQIT